MDNMPNNTFSTNDGIEGLDQSFEPPDVIDEQLTQNTDITFDSTTNPYGPYNPNVLNVSGVPDFNSQEDEAISGGKYEARNQQDSATNDRLRFASPEDSERRLRQVQAIRSYRQLVQQCVDSEGDQKIKDFLKLVT